MDLQALQCLPHEYKEREHYYVASRPHHISKSHQNQMGFLDWVHKLHSVLDNSTIPPSFSYENSTSLYTREAKVSAAFAIVNIFAGV